MLGDADATVVCQPEAHRDAGTHRHLAFHEVSRKQKLDRLDHLRLRDLLTSHDGALVFEEAIRHRLQPIVLVQPPQEAACRRDQTGLRSSCRRHGVWLDPSIVINCDRPALDAQRRPDRVGHFLDPQAAKQQAIGEPSDSADEFVVADSLVTNGCRGLGEEVLDERAAVPLLEEPQQHSAGDNVPPLS
ncbi:MAG: hypothetical protein ACR2GH_11250 [Pseudonocardia sp.]